jgi:hypothetical protein
MPGGGSVGLMYDDARVGQGASLTMLVETFQEKVGPLLTTGPQEDTLYTTIGIPSSLRFFSFFSICSVTHRVRSFAVR